MICAVQYHDRFVLCWVYVQSGPAGFRRAISDVIVPKMLEFNPELLIISAGFDGSVNCTYSCVKNDPGAYTVQIRVRSFGRGAWS
jgi:acetoin utilization deacetylase AcuC-like enzyme